MSTPAFGADPLHLEIHGGPTDPVSRHVVDIDAVHHGALRYLARAEDMALQGVKLTMIATEVSMAGRIADPVSVVARPVEAFGLVRLVSRLRDHLEDRRDLAERTRTAAILYGEVDHTNAVAMRRVLTGEDAIPMSRMWGPADEGLCSTSPRDPDVARWYAPTCSDTVLPEFHAEGLYGAQDLKIDAVTVVPTQVRPGLAGLLQTTHDGYAARTPDGMHEADAIDVHRRILSGQDGGQRASYVIALPGTSSWDPADLRRDPHRVRSMRPNLEGAAGHPSAEARLLPEVLRAAGVPDGAEVVLVGHSQGGMTAMTAAALPAMRRYRMHVVTAGSPVGRAPAVPSVKYLHLANRGDVVPEAEGAPNRPGPNQMTVTTGPERGLTQTGEAHDIGAYVHELDRIDEARRRGDLDPKLEQYLRSMDRAGHLPASDTPVQVETTRVTLRRV